jgi:putative mycofactocin binding protein MftB
LIDTASPYELHPQVALRPEPFGALAYHYGNRRLTFVRANELVDLLRTLGEHESVDDALAASDVAPGAGRRSARRWRTSRRRR